MPFLLLKNADLYAPQHLGIRDLLIADTRIVHIAEHIDIIGLPVQVIDLQGRIAAPGFIDRHVHLIGGGGQQGFASLVPDVTMSELVACGTTTVIGLLGTDGYVKDLPTLFAHVKGLQQEGISAYMLTSFYGLPERTITGSVAEDMIYLDPVIGCKLAMSDDRSCYPTQQEILRLVNQVRLGGFTSGKGGFLHIHLGPLPGGIQPLIDIAHKIPTLTRYLSPTHMIRTEELFRQSIEFARMGGFVDYSTGGTKYQAPHACVLEALANDVPLANISFSSDGHGGVRRQDPDTGAVTYLPAPMQLNRDEVMLMARQQMLPLSDALALITLNPANHMNLPHKGRLAVGADADLCLLDDQLQLTDVVCMGQFCMRNGNIVKKGRYEL